MKRRDGNSATGQKLSDLRESSDGMGIPVPSDFFYYGIRSCLVSPRRFFADGETMPSRPVSFEGGGDISSRPVPNPVASPIIIKPKTQQNGQL